MARPITTLHPRSSAALDETRLKAGLVNDHVHTIEVFEQIDSTNSYLLTQAIRCHSARLCAAEAQTAGRGRHGNVWLSEPGHNILMSLSWGFSDWPRDLSALSLVAGLAVAGVLIEDYKLDAKIKWPNDILVHNSKLAGILVDIQGHLESNCHVVIGLGLNVHQPNWSDDQHYPWVDLQRLGVVVDRTQLLIKLTQALIAALIAYQRHGFASMRERWLTHAAFKQQLVRLQHCDGELQGRVVGVDEFGHLLLQQGDVLHVIDDSNSQLRQV